MDDSENPFAVLHGCAEEVRTDASYRWDNARRGDADGLVIQVTLSGAAFYQDASGTRLVPPGYAMLFTHREPTSYGYPPGATQPYRHRYATFSLGGIRALFDRLRRDFGPVVKMPPRCQAAVVFEELFERFQARTFTDRFHQTEILYRLLISLYREQVRDRRETDPIEFGFHYLRDHFRTPVNLKTVAARCGVSREHFIREFSHRFGESPGGLLRRLRLNHARGMLRATGMPVQEVALACGFSSAHTFCRAFRRRFDRSPSQERVLAR